MANSRFNPTVLIALGAAVLILVGVLLLGLKQPRAKDPAPFSGPREVQRSAVAQTRTVAVPHRNAPPPPARAGGHEQRAEQGRAATATPEIPTRLVHTAPPAIPSEITEEKDPVRREQLTRMHRLAMARVRASQLRRRRDLLQATIERASSEKSMPAEQIERARRDLRELEAAITEAEVQLSTVRKEVGGDIDRDSP